MYGHKVKVVSIDEKSEQVFIDDKEMHGVTGLDIHLEPQCIPQTDIKLRSEPDVEIESLVTFEFTPKTYKMAMELLRVGLRKNDLTAFMGVNSLIAEIEKK